MKFAIFGNKHQTKKSQSIGMLFDAITKRGDTYAIDKVFYDFLREEQIAWPQPQEIITDNDFTADIAISFGGDGTLLRTASRVGSKAIPVLGINAVVWGILFGGIAYFLVGEKTCEHGLDKDVLEKCF